MAACVEPQHAVAAAREILGELVIAAAVLTVTMHQHHERGASGARCFGEPVTMVEAHVTTLEIALRAVCSARALDSSRPCHRSSGIAGT
jgi:hypothetical protein